jgi:hypothetical protein
MPCRVQKPLSGKGESFLDAIKAAFPRIDWDKAYKEFRAAGEKEK